MHTLTHIINLTPLLLMSTQPSSPFSHAHTRTHHQPDSSPPGLTQWACHKKASAYGSRVGWTLAQRNNKKLIL